MRFKLRTLLVMVMVVAVLLKAEVTRRRAHYRQQAAFHTAEQGKSEQVLRALKIEVARIDGRNARLARWGLRCCGNEHRYQEAIRSEAAIYTTRTAYHARLAKEFQRRWW